MKKYAFTILVLLSLALLSSCKKDKGDDINIEAYEHNINNISADSGQNLYDEEGFLIKNDKIYVYTENAELYDAPTAEGTVQKTVVYGDELERKGVNEENGYCKVLYDGAYLYVKSENITELVLDTDAEFSYMLSALSIVDTSRQFYTYEDMIEDMLEIKELNPDYVKLNVIGSSLDQRNIYDIVIGSEEAEHDIVVVGGMEGCEYMTSLFAAKLAEYYAYYYDDGIHDGYAYSQILGKCRLHIIPMLNPDGVIISQFNLDYVNLENVKTDIQGWFDRDQVSGGTSFMIETYLLYYYSNANGVDIAKNFPYEWESAGSAENRGRESYKGEAPASEAETTALIRLLDEVTPDVVINLRATGNSIMYDYSTNDEVVALSKEYATLVADVMGYDRTDEYYEDNTYGSLEGYVANSLDTPVMKIRIGNGQAPLSLNEYNSIWNSGRESLITLAQYILTGN